MLSKLCPGTKAIGLGPGSLTDEQGGRSVGNLEGIACSHQLNFHPHLHSLVAEGGWGRDDGTMFP